MNELIDFREDMHFSIEIICSIAKNFRSVYIFLRAPSRVEKWESPINSIRLRARLIV